MPLAGDLSTVSLADLFNMLLTNHREGTLAVWAGRVTKRIFFSPKGISLLSRGTGAHFRIGEMLVKRGKITRQQLAEALKKQKQVGTPLGALMKQEGWISQRDIVEVVRRQLEDEIYDLFLWRDARFEFQEGPMPERVDTAMPIPVMHLKFDVNALLLEGLRRVDEWDRINEKIEGLHCVFAFTDDETRKSAAAELSGERHEVARLLDGTRSLKQVRLRTGLSSFDVCKTAVELLEMRRLRQLSVEEVLQKARELEHAGNIEAALRLYCSLLCPPAAEGLDADVIVRSSKLWKKTGRLDEALGCYRRLAELYRDKGNTEGLVAVLDCIVDIAPDEIEAGLELFNLCASGRDVQKARRLGVQLLRVSETSERPDAARHVAARLMILEPHELQHRLSLVRILCKLGAHIEMREHLRFLEKKLQAGDREHQTLLQELRGLAPDFFGEKHVPPGTGKDRAEYGH